MTMSSCPACEKYWLLIATTPSEFHGRGMSTNESMRPVEKFFFSLCLIHCGIINDSHVSQSVWPINQQIYGSYSPAFGLLSSPDKL